MGAERSWPLARWAGDTNAPAKGGEAGFGVAAALSFVVVGWEQLQHTGLAALGFLPLYQAMHWVSDSLLALPLAVLAVWAGQQLAGRLGLSEMAVPHVLARATLICLLFAILLVPGAALHDASDRLTHAPWTQGLLPHGHGGAECVSPVLGVECVSTQTPFTYAAHALTDGLQGQLLGLPLAALMLLAVGRSRRRPTPRQRPEPADAARREPTIQP